MFAGVEQLRNGGTRPAATGRLCEWKEDPRWKYSELFMFITIILYLKSHSTQRSAMPGQKMVSKEKYGFIVFPPDNLLVVEIVHQRLRMCTISLFPPLRQPAFLFSSFGAYQRSLSLNCQEGENTVYPPNPI